MIELILWLLLAIIGVPFMLAMLVFVASKAARYGWLQGEWMHHRELFFKKEFPTKKEEKNNGVNS